MQSNPGTATALVVVLIAMAIAVVHAEVLPNPLLSDGAVLQQGMRVPVWGTAASGEKVTVTIGSETASAVARDGKWMVRLNPLKAGGPFTLKINNLEIKNVLVGEVWICSGQSNMGFPVGEATNGAEAVAACKDPMLRLFHVEKTISRKPLTALPPVDRQGDITYDQWRESAPDAARSFSAVGYFFAQELREVLKVPVGMIEAEWGGVCAQTWASRDALLAHPEFHQMLIDSDKTPMDGDPDPVCRLYNGMIAPLEPYGIRGAIWYQGEANIASPPLLDSAGNERLESEADRGWAYQYRTLFPTVIGSWRDAWGEGNFPFIFVQLAPFVRHHPDARDIPFISAEPGESAWAELREAQLMTSLACPNTAMAVTTDVGDPNTIHPPKKEPVGHRLALAAEALAYGKRIVYRGPVYKSMAVKSNEAVLHFDSVGGGLVAKNGDLKGFTIAGPDHKFVNAQAKIVGNTVVVSSPQVPHPTAARYGWANYPIVNLFNKEGLPASPFRTDDFQMVTGPKK